MIGAMEKRVTLQRPRRSDDAGGGAVVTYEDYARVWAALTPLSAAAASGGERDASRRRYRAVIRSRIDVDFMTRAVIDGCAFDVTDLREQPGAARLQLTLEEAV